MRRIVEVSAAFVALLLVAELAISQGMPPLPDEAEIERRIEEELDRLESRTVESDHLTLEYKLLPTDPLEVIRQAAGGQIPPGIDPDQAARQLLPMARPYIDRYAGRLGTLTAKSDLRFRSIRLSAGTTYEFGLLVENLVPVGVRIAGGDLRQPLQLPLSRARAERDVDPMVIEVIGPGGEGRPPSRGGRIGFEVQFGEVHGVAGWLVAR